MWTQPFDAGEPSRWHGTALLGVQIYMQPERTVGSNARPLLSHTAVPDAPWLPRRAALALMLMFEALVIAIIARTRSNVSSAER
jgi:hypothetical protein